MHEVTLPLGSIPVTVPHASMRKASTILGTRPVVFLGVDQQLLEVAEEQAEVPFEVSVEVAERSRGARQQTAVTESVSLDGTCMRVEGLPL